MEILRTPDARFENLPGWSFEPRYVEVDGLRIHHVDEGPVGAPAVLLLHGEPTWAYLYRTMIPVIAGAGLRAVAIDFAGFGRSDKPSDPSWYTYRSHIDAIAGAIEAIGLRDITLFGQDWGGLVGLRVALEMEDRFSRLIASNTFLPTGDPPPPEIWFMFRDMVANAEVFDVPRTIQAGTKMTLPDEVLAAYDAPFPDESFKVGARRFPQLVPADSGDPEGQRNTEAWKVLETWEKPFLTLFGDSDPITRGGDRSFQKRVPGAAGQPHATIEGAGHFCQEDAGATIASHIVDWLAG